MIPEAWGHLPFFRQHWGAVEARLNAETRQILPERANWFRALAMTPPDKVKVVLLGQDPYPTPGHATGLAFSVTAGTPLPRSLANVFREMQDDIGARPANGDLSFWASQGVLLLNTCLTVPAGEAGGHSGLGWQGLTEDVLAEVSRRPTAFLLWGGHAQKLGRTIAGNGHLMIASAHPSPLSARRGFFGSRPFSQINRWLADKGEALIRWA